ncbi:MAG: hypothetical protein R3E79_40285 [Caldilineaceae bacterium]
MRIPQTCTCQVDGRTHGIAITHQGQVVLFHQVDPAVVIYSPAGEVIELFAGLWRRLLDQPLRLCY